MAFLLSAIFKALPNLIELRDKRMDDYFFVQSPIRPLAVLIIYTLFVYRVGPQIMRHKKPYDLREMIMVFNILQILINSYLVLKGGELLMVIKPSLLCFSIDWNDNNVSREVTKLFYVYFVSKILDLMDTVFFVLRKKRNQITFLHVYHHIGMTIIAWISCRYFPGGQSSFLGFINAIIHVIMYFYYFLSSWNPKYATIQLKKTITLLQIAQHSMIFFIFFIPLLNPHCDYPKLICYAMVPQALLMFCLFVEFYIKAYGNKIEKKT